ncbi:MAG: dephospho-CoA kinase [Chloroflexota bacterium]|nr:MAG: dephospho-CoA kinase [Chloroflexota bacterium]
MSAWPGKYVIGLTGNIATGKSVVRKMLEHLGAYGIDADALAHRAIAKDAPGYQPVLASFGTWLLNPEGQIDRTRLGKIVFSDPEALALLEAIVHPLVRQAIDLLVRHASQDVVVIEAIKLLEGPLRHACDKIWVTTSPTELQLRRLQLKRGLSAEIARQRIAAQPPQSQKIEAADVVIQNDDSFEATWQQVLTAWKRTLPEGIGGRSQPASAGRGGLLVERAGPRQVEEIAEFVTQISKGRRTMTPEEVMAAFGEKAFMLLKIDERLVGLAGWQVENLVARVSDLYLEPGLALGEAVRVLMKTIEDASRELQSEALLLFLPPYLGRHAAVWDALGYTTRSPQELGFSAWEEAALESMPVGTVMFFKQLRKDRVLKPV